MSYRRYKGLFNSKSNFTGDATFKNVDAPSINSTNINSTNINSTNIKSSSYIKNDKLNFSFNGEDISQHADYLKKRTVFIETTDEDSFFNKKVGTGVLIHENEIYNEGTSNKIYVITAGHVVAHVPNVKDNGEIIDANDITIAKDIKVMYYTKNNSKRISYLRVVGYCISIDLALCEFINYDEYNTTDDSTWYTSENVNNIESVKLFKMNLNNINNNVYHEGAKVIACGHTYVDDPFSITSGYIRSCTHMTEKYENSTKSLDGNDYNVATPSYSPYFLSALNLGPGNSGCGIFLQNHNLELIGIHSTSIKEGDEHTASMNAHIPPYILNSNIFKRMITGYNSNSNESQRIYPCFINLDIYSTTDIMDKDVSDNIVKNCLLINNVNTNLVFGRLTTSIDNRESYIYNGETFTVNNSAASIFTDNNLITKLDVLDSSANTVVTYNIGDEYPKIPLHAIRILVEPDTYIRVYYYSDLEDYSEGVVKTLENDIIKLHQIEPYFDKPPYSFAYYSVISP
jgi:hypothetical protein